MSTPFLNKLNAVIAQNLHNEQFKIPQLCRQLGTNHVSLNNKIKHQTGQSTGQYIRNFRLAKAKYLLQHTTMPVGEIASAVGVPEASNFIFMFKKAYGSSPNQWRITCASTKQKFTKS